MSSSGTDYLFPIEADDVADTQVVGAKARSLQQMTAFGLRVPSGFILTTGFFEPWFDIIQHSPSWDVWRTGTRELWPALCAAIRAAALNLPFSDAQQLTLVELSGCLAKYGPAQRFAVRSSSPDEDTATASFAGLYETELGRAPGELEGAIRRCFSACFDYRVFAYKSARCMDVDRLSIALIIQLQIDSDVAGVGFSVNPLSNDYDEAVIDANWGLGESVVAGKASPDHFVVDKINGTVVERQLGAKHASVVLASDSGTTTAPHLQRGAYCLTETQLVELSTAISGLETMYGHPVDMEWAYAGGELFILQARPITTYVPLPAEMVTMPGARRALYMDIALSKGMTSNAAISPIGLDWLAGDMALMMAHCIGNGRLDVKSPAGLLYLGGARMYMNLSNLLWFTSPARLAKGNAPTDQLMADTLAGIDPLRYRAERRPAWIWPALRVLPGALWRLRRALWRASRSVLAPASTHRLYLRERQAFEQIYSGAFDDTLSLSDFQRRYGPPAIAHIIDADMPALGIGVLGVGMVKRLARKGHPEDLVLAEQLSRGISGNLVVDMGIRIYRLAKMLEVTEFDDLEVLSAQVQRRQLPAAFLIAWDDFMRDYGCRGPGEMDMANRHYADDPMLVLRQMSFVARSGGEFNPEARHQELVSQRQQAYEELAERFGWARRVLLRRANKLIELFGGARDTPKQHNLMYQHAARNRLLVEGKRLVTNGRLDRPEQVFDLALSDLVEAGGDPAVDLRQRSYRRTRFANQLMSHVRTFPSVIDSRGRIQRPPRRPETPGELAGMAVSPGIVRGKIKVMHNPHEKAVYPGEILVAFTTDPGWTPLFINAAAVILEVGGVLQHGAVVAREYGKPCVAGIADVLTRFHDGQLVEVDGSTGVVRFITEKSVTTG